MFRCFAVNEGSFSESVLTFLTDVSCSGAFVLQFRSDLGLLALIQICNKITYYILLEF